MKLQGPKHESSGSPWTVACACGKGLWTGEEGSGWAEQEVLQHLGSSLLCHCCVRLVCGCGTWGNGVRVSLSPDLVAEEGGGCPEQQCPQQSATGGGGYGCGRFLVHGSVNESGWRSGSGAQPLPALGLEL